jgi:hypothetical protein
VRYFEIKTVDIKRMDIERSEAPMSHRHLAATAWELEAERRREVLGGEVRRRSGRKPGLRFADLGRRVRGLFPSVPPTGKLDQKRA